MPQISPGLLLGFITSAMTCVMESIGDYSTCARVSYESQPPTSSINRAITCEGFGTALGGIMGVGTGVITYSENIAIMQCAGLLLIVMGLFTKIAAVFATIPEAIIGGVLAMGLSRICGVALSVLHCAGLFWTGRITDKTKKSQHKLHPFDRSRARPAQITVRQYELRSRGAAVGSTALGWTPQMTFAYNTVVGHASLYESQKKRGFGILGKFNEQPTIKYGNNGYELPKWIIRLQVGLAQGNEPDMSDFDGVAKNIDNNIKFWSHLAFLIVIGRICETFPPCQCIKNCYCPNRWVPDDMRCNEGYTDIKETEMPSKKTTSPISIALNANAYQTGLRPGGDYD